MIMDHTNLVSAADLRRLTYGSFEHKIASLKETIVAEVGSKIGIAPADLDLIATFEDRAVVQGPEHKFYNATLAKGDDNSIRVVGVQTEQVAVLDHAGLGAHVESEVEAAVAAWLGGDPVAARDRIAAVLPFVASTPGGDESQALGTVESRVTLAYRPWRVQYEARKSSIHRFVVNHFEKLEATKLARKYGKLYDGSISEDKLEGYEEIVESDLAIVLRRFKQLSEATSKSVENARPAIAKAKSADNGTIQLYNGFAEDLIHDLASVEKLAERASTRVGSVSGRGRLRDILAEALHQYEVASRFVVEVADRLTQAA